MRAVLVAAVEQQLQAEADAEERPAGADVSQHGVAEAGVAELGDGVPERPDPGQHHLVGGRHPVRVRGYLGRRPDRLERLLDAPQVGHPVIDDHNPGRDEG